MALLIAGCARMPSSLVSGDGSSLKFASNTRFVYVRPGHLPVKCERKPDKDWNSIYDTGLATCDDGTEGQFERQTGGYFSYIQVSFDGHGFAVPGEEYRKYDVISPVVSFRSMRQ
ncbi:hypothetical protein [Devosia sp.]|uniref:hypothetical protein n=1 Tax=Devosia sp. TaxID=1871048 RepID=UPI002618D085|nr:hypothetical protein [Devosia sp.]